MDEDFFINLANGFDKLLQSIGGVVDGLGGLKGIATLAGSIFLNVYS
jgi:hypothetical protein